MFKEVLRESFPGLCVTLLVAVVCVFLAEAVKYLIRGAGPVAARLLVGFSDAFLLGLIVGIVIRSLAGFRIRTLTAGFLLAPLIFIPIGTLLYGAKYLNIVKFYDIVQFKPLTAILTAIFMIIYISTICLLSKLLKIDERTCYLTAVGSATEASAIAITFQTVEAEPRHVSTSLLSIFLVAVLGITIIYPQIAEMTRMPAEEYGIFTGGILQFIGFVKAATGLGAPAGLQPVIAAQGIQKNVALPLTAFRFLWLLVLIPLFATLARRKPYIPWFLWGFLLVGLLFSTLYAAGERPNCDNPTSLNLYGAIYCKAYAVSDLLVNYLWTVVMVAIGLQIDIRDILNIEFLKTFLIAFTAFIINVSAFLLCIRAGFL